MGWGMQETLLEDTTMATTHTTLDKLEPGQEGVVTDVDVSNPLGRRLLELGIIPGQQARMLRRAPLGDPIEIGLSSSYLSLRLYEASLVRLSLNS
jgi:ferrous iron transport protein A